MALNHVYCDESHIGKHDYRIQGGIWVPEIGMRLVRTAFKDLRAKHPKMGEFKWEYVTGKAPLRAYSDLIDLFFSSEAGRLLCFKSLVVARADDASLGSGKHERDLGFYKAYFVLLRYRLWTGADHHVRLDEKSGPRAAAAAELMQCLNRAATRDLKAPYRVLTCRHESSKNEDLLQLADVLCGALGWAWNGRKSTCGAKPILHDQIAAYVGVKSLDRYSTWGSAPKYNVWHFQPRK